MDIDTRGIKPRLSYFHVRLHDNQQNKRDLAMDDVQSAEESQDEKEDSLTRFVRKSETRKAAVEFENALRETHVEENRLQNSQAGKNGRRADEEECKRERPTSADASWSKCLLERSTERRPRSSAGGRCPWGPRASLAGLRGCPCCDTFQRFPGFPLHLRRKCKSSCNFSNAGFHNCEKMAGGERDFQKVQRSLRLLGFEPSDFGVLSGRAETAPKWRPTRRSPTLSTRVTSRSISLDSLRLAVRRAWLDDTLDESHRRLLAQAAYEEWYFTKERELREKREEDRIKQLNTKLKLRDDFQRKKEKSEEEFQKWLSRKAVKRKGRQATFLQNHEKPLSRLTETKEKSDTAFLNWKKIKDREMEKRKTEKRKEEEKRIEREKQKEERKVIAEKAFQQWKMKLEENERKRDSKREIHKRKQEVEERKKRAEGSHISFQVWKEAKDKEIKQKIKQHRENDRTAREERCAQIEERMYEAEQAFEDWIEQVDSRKEKQCYSINCYQKNIPWIPV